MVSQIFTIQNVEDFRQAIKSSIKNTNYVPEKAIQNSVSAFLYQTGLTDECVDILNDELKCAICFEIPLNACLTKCHHIFCVYCLNMCLLTTKWQCPMCRTELPKKFNHNRLYKVDTIIDEVKSKHNLQYMSWKKEQLLERFGQMNAESLQRLLDVIVKLSQDLKSFDNVRLYRRDLDNLTREFLLLTMLQCSEANVKRIRRKKGELCRSVRHIVRQLPTLVGFPVEDIIENLFNLEYLPVW